MAPPPPLTGVDRRQREEEPDEHERGASGAHSEHEPLYEELPDDPLAAGAQGITRRELLLPRDGPSVDQDGDVGTGRGEEQCDEDQDEASHPGVNLDTEPARIGHNLSAEWPRGRLPASGGSEQSDRLQLGLGAFERGAGRESRKHEDAWRLALRVS